ncbi:MAG TPA: hypothetical protein VLX91_05545 [Candidatus Acidoferrales bacterium]|nr:hypothetical protein [Candidatus Acidoferrales bacterium]
MNISFAGKLEAVLLLMVSFVALSCKSDNTLVAPTLTTSIVTGLWITNSSGPTPIAVWGNPSDGSGSGSGGFGFNGGINERSDSIVAGIPRYFVFHIPYPNPAPGVTEFVFDLPIQSVVDLWIVKARWVGEQSSDETLEGSATTITPERNTVKIFLRSNLMYAGQHTETWSGTDDNGRPVPAGFYRVYWRVNGFLAFHDIFLYRQLSDLPIDLRKITDV